MNPPKLLILADTPATAQAAAAALQAGFDHVAISLDAEAGAADFARALPDVVLLAFTDLAVLQTRYTRLVEAQVSVPGHHHRTLILCRPEDAHTSHELCEQGRFDDDLCFWPPNADARRLVMSVRQARLRLRCELALVSAASEIADYAQRNAALGAALAAQSGTGSDPACAPNGLVHHAQQRVMALWRDARAAGAQRQAPGAASAELLDRVDDLLSSSRALRDDTALQVDTVHAQLANTAAARRLPQVLVVEDDEFQQEMVAGLLQDEGVAIERAMTGAQALESITTVVPTLILLDYQLPDTDGISLLLTLRAMPALARVPIIMMTGNSDRQVVVTSLQAGASEFIVKPLDPAKLRAKLRLYLARAA